MIAGQHRNFHKFNIIKQHKIKIIQPKCTPECVWWTVCVCVWSPFMASAVWTSSVTHAATCFECMASCCFCSGADLWSTWKQKSPTWWPVQTQRAEGSPHAQVQYMLLGQGRDWGHVFSAGGSKTVSRVCECLSNFTLLPLFINVSCIESWLSHLQERSIIENAIIIIVIFEFEFIKFDPLSNFFSNTF